MRDVRERSPAAKPTAYFPQADALRAIAIGFVVANHTALFGQLHLFGHPTDLAFLGRWGVNCFFVLTGSLLSRPYLVALFEGRPASSLATYASKRVLRIVPLYVAAVVASALFEGALRGHFPVSFLLTHLAFVQGFALASVNDAINAPLWTMAIDAEFYIALPFVAGALAWLVRGRSKRDKARAVVAALALVVVASMAYRYAAFARYPRAYEDFSLAVLVVRNVIGMSAAFAFGTALSLLEVLHVRRDRRAAFAGVAIGLVGFAAIVSGKSAGYTGQAKVWADLVAAFSAASVLYAVSSDDARTFARIASSRIVTTVAILAYGIYLVHWPILRALAEWYPKLAGMRIGSVPYCLALAVLGIALAMAVAYALHRAIERPFLAVKARL